jgi:transcriptional regulator with PAS, ATPase and Fis domain
LLFSCGRDDEAEAILSTARRNAVRSGDRAARARIEVALGDGAVTRDDHARAHGHLDTARRQVIPAPSLIAARAWIVEARLARAEARPAPTWNGVDPAVPIDPADRLDLGVELALERAVCARLARDWPMARDQLERARELAQHSASPRWIALVEIEIGLYSAEVDDAGAGYTRIRNAIDVLAQTGAKRDEGRAMIRLADMMSSKRVGPAHESAALWLGRALAALGPAATWRDRSAVRAGLRVHGRRIVDRVMPDGIAARIDQFERVRGALLSARSISSEAAECALNELEAEVARGDAGYETLSLLERVRVAVLSMSAKTAPATEELDGVVHDLVEFIGAALVERDRMRSLLLALSNIDAASDENALPTVVARVAARILEADHVVFALAKDGQLEAVGQWGEAPAAMTGEWRVAMLDAIGRDRPKSPPEIPVVLRDDENVAGSVLVAPMRVGAVDGALYADKLARSGKFRKQDQSLAFLLAEYGAIALSRSQALDQERSAQRRLAVTLDAIRDGVVAWDGEGVILSCNATLERMLRLSREEVLGAQVAQVPALARLVTLVTLVGSGTPASSRVDGVVVRLATGSFVVSARPLAGTDDTSARGTVVTLVELDRAQKVAQRLGGTRTRYVFQDIVGTSPALLAAVSMAKRAATVDSTVLITGESGTGKEIVAQAIHSGGSRAGEPFVGVNVAALPRELLEAELFGCERGAFTGARSDGHLGKFELAAGGTILLDEIGELPMDTQAKLLRVLQERVVVRLGGSVERPVHARVIATTHRDLSGLVEEGKFRMDLLYRLRVLSIEMPPLRGRPEDIQALAKHYLRRFAEQQRKRVRALGPRVYDELESYGWPGNIRELANVIEAEVSILSADVDRLDRLSTRIGSRLRGSPTPSSGRFPAVAPGIFAPSSPVIPLAELEKMAYLHALERYDQNVARASEALGVSNVTFYRKLRAWGLHPRDQMGGEEVPADVRRLGAADPPTPSFEPPTVTSIRKSRSET